MTKDRIVSFDSHVEDHIDNDDRIGTLMLVYIPKKDGLRDKVRKMGTAKCHVTLQFEEENSA